MQIKLALRMSLFPPTICELARKHVEPFVLDRTAEMPCCVQGSDRNLTRTEWHLRSAVPQDKFDSPQESKYLGARPERDRITVVCSVHSSREKEQSSAPETEMAETGKAAATPAPTPALAEGSVIPIHSLDEWSMQIDEANSTADKKLVFVDIFLSPFFFCLLQGSGYNQPVLLLKRCCIFVIDVRVCVDL